MVVCSAITTKEKVMLVAGVRNWKPYAGHNWQWTYLCLSNSRA